MNGVCEELEWASTAKNSIISSTTSCNKEITYCNGFYYSLEAMNNVWSTNIVPNMMH
jgi:hypothetical protein